MSLLRDLIHPGGPRVHAYVTVGTCAALCTALIILCVAAAAGRSLQVEIAAVVTALSSLVGWVYNVGKKAGVEAPTAPGGGPVPGNGSNAAGGTP